MCVKECACAGFVASKGKRERCVLLESAVEEGAPLWGFTPHLYYYYYSKGRPSTLSVIRDPQSQKQVSSDLERAASTVTGRTSLHKHASCSSLLSDWRGGWEKMGFTSSYLGKPQTPAAVYNSVKAGTARGRKMHFCKRIFSQQLSGSASYSQLPKCRNVLK